MNNIADGRVSVLRMWCQKSERKGGLSWQEFAVEMRETLSYILTEALLTGETFLREAFSGFKEGRKLCEC
jgi:hypothetical protein